MKRKLVLTLCAAAVLAIGTAACYPGGQSESPYTSNNNSSSNGRPGNNNSGFPVNGNNNALASNGNTASSNTAH